MELYQTSTNSVKDSAEYFKVIKHEVNTKPNTKIFRAWPIFQVTKRTRETKTYLNQRMQIHCSCSTVNSTM